jgi:hypothetical protein
MVKGAAMLQRAGILTVQIQTQHPPRSTASGALGISILVVGLALITYGVVVTLRSRQWHASASPAEGHVVDNVPRPRRGRTVWLPLIEFEADGQKVRFSSVAAANRRGWPLGHAVDVLYDPGNPQRVGMAETGWHISLALVVGVAVLGVALAVSA